MSIRRHIVVGVDGSAGGRRALGWAALEAQQRGVALHAVTAWRWDTAVVTETSDGDEADEAARILAAEMRAVSEASELGAAMFVIEGRPVDVLVKAAAEAELLVLGSHGHSHRLQEVLGSVTEECIRHATCPVVIIPAK